ncbi:MAG: DUF4405 domain-containing protein [Methanosarcinaceae archaeon]|nr:DUF4405 domain-containing protein [Methanosarcinaceae archaeon]
MKTVKTNYFLDVVIGLAFLASAASGLAFIVMGDGGYQGGRNGAFATVFLGLARSTWSNLHLLTSLVMIAGIGLHLVLHWRWISCITKQFLPQLPRKTEEPCEVIA